MPFESSAQARFFNANRKQLEKQGVNVDEWTHSTDFSHLPERAGQNMANKSGNWMQSESDREEKAGTKGVFSSAAAKAGKTTAEFANEHEHDSGKLGRRARLAKAFMSSKH